MIENSDNTGSENPTIGIGASGPYHPECRRLREACNADGNYDSRLLEIVRIAASQLLGKNDWRRHVGAVLKALGETVNICRVRLFELELDENDSFVASPDQAWVCARCELHQREDVAAPVSFAELGLERWQRTLSSGKALTVLSKQCPPSEQAFLDHFDLRSVLVVPIEAAGRLWGLLGFAVACEFRLWSQREVDLLHAVARIVGAAVEQGRQNASSRRQENLFRSLVNHLPVGLIRALPRGDSPVIMANPAVAEIFGYAMASDMMSLPIRNLFENPGGWRNLMVAALGAPTIGSREYPCVRADGRRIWTALTTSLVRSDDGEPMFIEIVVQDVTQRRNAEEALRISEAKYRDLIESQTDLVVRLNLDMRFTFANESFARAVGRSRAALSGDHAGDYVHPDDHSILGERFEHLVRTGEKATAELRVKSGNAWRWVEWEGYLIAGIADRPSEIQAVGRDVTDRVEAEEALGVERRNLRAVLDTIPDAVYLKDLDGKLLVVNNRFAEGMPSSTRTSPSDYIGATDYDFYDKATADAFREMDLEVMDKGRTIRQENHKRDDKGREMWLEYYLSPLKGDDGRLAGMVGVIRDITALREADRSIRHERKLLRTIIDTIPNYVYMKDTEGRFVLANRSFVLAKGFKEESELLGVDDAQHQSPERREHCRRKDAELLKEGKVIINHEHVWTTAEGRLCCHLFNSAPIRDDAGEIVGLIGIITDLSDLRRAERAVQQAHNELVNAREVERRRLATELHDALGQSIVALHMTMQGISLVAERTGLDTATLVDPLRTAARRCGELVREVRQICHGLFPPVLGTLGLEAALSSLARDFAATIGVTLEYDPDLVGRRLPEPVEIALFRVAQEAVSNAARHGDAEDVSIVVEFDDRGDLVLRVADNGNGFDKDAVSGEGLGLKSMAERASAVGGRLAFDSTLGEGATVILTIPAAVVESKEN